MGDNIQKVDYVYNINGWLKSINHPLTGTGPVDGPEFGPDVFAEALHYFKGDYQRTGTGLEASAAITPQAGTALGDQVKDLFSGNISSIVSYTGFDKTASGNTPSLMGQAYQYDYLGRLVDTYTAQSTSTGFNGFTGDVNSYRQHEEFDANGNITSLSRIRNGGAAMDQLTYKYATKLVNGVPQKADNRLLHVNDAVSTTGLPDIKDQGVYDENDPTTWNYTYDEKGRMVSNRQDSIASIEWTPYDKIKRIVPTVSQKPLVEFTYNAMQQRQSKKVTKSDGSYIETIYAYDVDGQLTATYSIEHKTDGTDSYRLNEFYIYGQDRLGSYAANEDLSMQAASVQMEKSRLRFVISDHLGNVRAVVTGEKSDEGNATLVSLSDYYPYGMEMPGRSFVNETYRFGYNDKEFDREWMKYDYGFRMYDPLLCRFLNVDPLARAFPELTPFQYASNDPILNIDLDGLEGTPAKENTDNFTYSTAREYTFDRYSSHLLPLTTNTSAANSSTYVAASKYIPKQTFVGPSNPQGYNQDYLNQQQTQRYYTALKENYIQQGQNIDPICFGGPGIGAYGTNQTLPVALKEVPFIILPELALDKLQELRTLSKLKAIAEVTSKDGVANQVHWGCEFLEANERMIDLPYEGSLFIESGGAFSESEIGAAEYMKNLSNNVILRKPRGMRIDGETSDLLVNGVKYDVYTPITNNPNRIISAMCAKNSQTTGIVLDLSKTNVTAEQLGNALYRVRKAGATNIHDIVIMPK